MIGNPRYRRGAIHLTGTRGFSTNARTAREHGLKSKVTEIDAKHTFVMFRFVVFCEWPVIPVPRFHKSMIPQPGEGNVWKRRRLERGNIAGNAAELPPRHPYNGSLFFPSPGRTSIFVLTNAFNWQHESTKMLHNSVPGKNMLYFRSAGPNFHQSLLVTQ